jgi:HEAT repeat protein
LDLLKKGDEFLGKDVAETLGKIGPEAKVAVPELTGWLTKESQYSRSTAARALGRIGPEAKAAVPALKQLRDDEKKSVRVWAAFALARITGENKAQVSYLTELWKEGGGEAGRDLDNPRFDLAQAFEILGADAAPARDLLLDAMLSEKTPLGTCKCVARALGQMRPDAAIIVPKMVQLIERKADSTDRYFNCTLAAEVLGMLGPNAQAGLPALRRLLDDGDGEIAEAAARAVARIEGK